MSKVCEKCGKSFPNRAIINGEQKNLQNRRYCLDCSPWGQHNTTKIPEKQGFKVCCKCKEEKPLSEFHKKNAERLQSYCKPCLYEIQKSRWISRKIEAVELMGGKCCKCGYSKNFNALQFHHLDPSQKDFDWNQLRLRSWNSVVLELKKCILVCGNCHCEIHWPVKDDECNSNNRLNADNPQILPTGKCPSCNGDVYGTKYCSTKCASVGCRKAKERPGKEELVEMLKTTPYTTVGKRYGVSDNAVRKWLKTS